MKEVPILFQREMIQAYMAGRKRMTRRTRGLDEINKAPDDWMYMGINPDGTWIFHKKHEATTLNIEHQYGMPGRTLLWFRENWRKDDFAPDDVKRTIFQADIPDDVLEAGKGIISWKPSIHLPRSRARHTSPLLKARVERLQDITEADAQSEGVVVTEDRSWVYQQAGLPYQPHKELFEALWKSINGDESWDLNPWVGVYEFESYKGDGS